MLKMFPLISSPTNNDYNYTITLNATSKFICSTASACAIINYTSLFELEGLFMPVTKEKSGSGQAPAYLKRIARLKERVLSTKPEMDLENARLLTAGFHEAEGEPLVLRKAKAFQKTVPAKDGNYLGR
jgi:hypothetical protein